MDRAHLPCDVVLSRSSTLEMEALRYFMTLIPICVKITRCHNPINRKPHFQRCVNLSSHMDNTILSGVLHALGWGKDNLLAHLCQSVVLSLGTRQPPYLALIDGTHYCCNGNSDHLLNALLRYNKTLLLEHIVSAVGTKGVVGIHCCNNKNRGRYQSIVTMRTEIIVGSQHCLI